MDVTGANQSSRCQSVAARESFGFAELARWAGSFQCHKMCYLEELNRKSGQGRDRTGDTWIFSPLLYQLSYLTNRFGISAERESEFNGNGIELSIESGIERQIQKEKKRYCAIGAETLCRWSLYLPVPPIANS